MKKALRMLAGTGLAILAISSHRAALSSIISFEGETSELTSSKVTLGASGVVTYELTGRVGFAGQSDQFFFSVVGAYDPKSHRAEERLTERNGNRIVSQASCPSDPWQVSVACSSASISSSGYDSRAKGYISTLSAPLSALNLNNQDRQTLRAKYQDAVNAQKAAQKAADDAKKAAEEAKARELALMKPNPGAASKVGGLLPTATPTPKFVGIAAGAGLTGNKLAAVAATVTPAPLPRPQYPPYGAAYTSNPLRSSMKVNQLSVVPVTVKNLSAQAWPAGGVFRLAYHWYRGGEIVHDGVQTLMTTTVAPGTALTLNANVTAPPSAGPATLKWDMLKQGGPWFSDQGVAMSAPVSTNITP